MPGEHNGIFFISNLLVYDASNYNTCFANINIIYLTIADA